MLRRHLMLAAGALPCGLLPALTAVATETAFPSRPVRIVVPQTPGGASDVLARIVGQKLGEKWGQPVIIENRAGAGGNVGMEAVANAPADGHVLLMSYVGTQAINGALYPKLPFDPVADFAPVAILATLPFVLVTRADAPWRSVSELIDVSGRERVTYGSAGNGSVNHLLGEMFNIAAHRQLVHVPYRGAAPALQGLMGGQIDLVFTSLPSVAAMLRAGTLRGVAVTSAHRAAAFPEIATVAEAGLRDFDVNPWFGLMAPKRTPAETLRRLNADVNEVLRNREIVASFSAQGAEPAPTSPEAFGQRLRTDAVTWGAVVRRSGARVD